MRAAGQENPSVMRPPKCFHIWGFFPHQTLNPRYPARPMASSLHDSESSPIALDLPKRIEAAISKAGPKANKIVVPVTEAEAKSEEIRTIGKKLCKEGFYTAVRGTVFVENGPPSGFIIVLKR